MTDISILTPALLDTTDKVLWLKEAVQSCQSQTVQDWEMIVVDDASPLPLPEFSDERVRVVRTADRSGPALCRNTAVALARSEALLPLDADDALAGSDVLKTLLAGWDGKSIVYGDLQQLKDGQRQNVVKFSPYDFKRVLDPRGLIPVTALHSRACHVAAGGWKQELIHGLEDVEYWIAAGERGFCGVYVPHLILLYRRHADSRTMRMRATKGQEGESRQRIFEMHRDSYEGRYPMGCCSGGGGARTATVPAVPTNRQAQRVAVSSAFRNDETVWVQYKGKRGAAFGVVGPATGTSYKVDGQGFVFPIHVTDADLFRRAGRGQDFAVGVAPPQSATPPPPPVQAAPPPPPPPPRVAVVERLDRIASLERQAIERKDTPLAPLDLGPVGEMLELESWTIEKLAAAEVNELTAYKGIGPTRAAQIIKKAKDKLGRA